MTNVLTAVPVLACSRSSLYNNCKQHSCVVVYCMNVRSVGLVCTANYGLNCFIINILESRKAHSVIYYVYVYAASFY